MNLHLTTRHAAGLGNNAAVCSKADKKIPCDQQHQVHHAGVVQCDGYCPLLLMCSSVMNYWMLQGLHNVQTSCTMY